MHGNTFFIKLLVHVTIHVLLGSHADVDCGDLYL